MRLIFLLTRGVLRIWKHRVDDKSLMFESILFELRHCILQTSMLLLQGSGVAMQY